MRKLLRVMAGILAANAVGLSLWAINYWLLATKPAASLAVSGSVGVIPFVVGLVGAWVWRPLRPGIGQTFLYALITTAVGLWAGFVFFGEGVVCLILLSPILLTIVVAGAFMGRAYLARNETGRLHATFIPAVALFALLEPHLYSAQVKVVIDEVQIAAPPSKVWPHVLKFEPIAAPPDYWLFSCGLPYPVSTTNGGDFVGADRACIFKGGAVFKERVVELEPERLLTFDIIEQPADPELIGHLNSRRGQFELRANPDGTTTLIGRTWYTLHVRPAWYFDLWTHDIFSAVHLRVMNNVKHLAESK